MKVRCGGAKRGLCFKEICPHFYEHERRKHCDVSCGINLPPGSTACEPVTGAEATENRIEGDPSNFGDRVNFERRNMLKDVLIQEIESREGPTGFLTANILRLWSEEKRRRFALHLLGDEAQNREAEIADLRNRLERARDALGAMATMAGEIAERDEI